MRPIPLNFEKLKWYAEVEVRTEFRYLPPFTWNFNFKNIHFKITNFDQFSSISLIKCCRKDLQLKSMDFLKLDDVSLESYKVMKPNPFFILLPYFCRIFFHAVRWKKVWHNLSSFICYLHFHTPYLSPSHKIHRNIGLYIALKPSRKMEVNRQSTTSKFFPVKVQTKCCKSRILASKSDSYS